MKLLAGESVTYLTMLESHRGKIPGRMTLTQETDEAFTGEVAIMGQMLPLENCSIVEDVYLAHIEGPHHPFDLEFSVTSEGDLQGIVNAPGHDPMKLTGKIPEVETQETATARESKTLVLCFSAQGRTKGIAEELTAKLGADFYEIKPLHPYTEADLKWTNPLARCNREKFGKKSVPTAGVLS